MKKTVVTLITTALFFWLSSPVITDSKTPAKGETLPGIKLLIPKNPGERNYLGLSDRGSFQIPHVRAGVVIIEIFSLYCPHCQAFAPEVNILYRMIEQVPDFRDKIKMIGIGAGNSFVEAETFGKTYDVPFPLFPDEDFSIHKLLGEVRTPYFIVIKINRDRIHQIIYSKPGGFGEAEIFLQKILEDSGLKQ